MIPNTEGPGIYCVHDLVEATFRIFNMNTDNYYGSHKQTTGAPLPPLEFGSIMGGDSPPKVQVKSLTLY